MRRFPVALFMILTAACATDSGVATDSIDGRLVVAVSVPPQAWFVRQLAGDNARVEVMLPPGANPATFEPTAARMRALEQASLYVKVGHPAFPFERVWLQRLLSQRPQLPMAHTPGVLDEAPADDPHVWLSPSWARRWVPLLASDLRELLPQSSDFITANERQLIATINTLSEEIRDVLEPFSGRSFLVYHPAWGHFARDYGIGQLSVETDGKEPGARRLAGLLKEASAAGVRVVFVEPQSASRSAEVLAVELGAEVGVIDPLAADWAANLLLVAHRLHDAFGR